MARAWKVWGQRLGYWCVLLVLTVPGVAWGAEFSASMMVKDDAKVMPGKIQVQRRQDAPGVCG